MQHQSDLNLRNYEPAFDLNFTFPLACPGQFCHVTACNALLTGLISSGYTIVMGGVVSLQGCLEG